MQTSRMQHKGLSLIELMVVIAVAAILMSVGVPSFRDLIESQRLTATVNDFFAAINLARSEAIKRGRRVDLVPLSSDENWAKGWVVFIDDDDDQRPDPDEQVIYSQGEVHGGIEIDAKFTDSKKQYIAYSGTGRTRTNANSQVTQVGSMTFKSDRQIRKISLNFLGRARVCRPDADGKGC